MPVRRHIFFVFAPMAHRKCTANWHRVERLSYKLDILEARNNIPRRRRQVHKRISAVFVRKGKGICIVSTEKDFGQNHTSDNQEPLLSNAIIIQKQ